MKDEIYLVRSETLLGFEDLVRELGVDPEPLYHRAGLPASLFDNLDYMVPYSSICALMEIAAKELMQEDFGLIQGSRLKTLQLGVLGPLMAQCPNLGEALKVGIEYFHLHNQGLTWSLTVDDDIAFMTREESTAGDIPTFQYTVLSMCACYRYLKSLCGKDWYPLAVNFVYAPPTRERAYHHFFDTKIEFNQEFNRISFSASFLSKKISGRDEDLYNQLNKQVIEMEAQSERSFLSKIKWLIQYDIHTEACTQTAIASSISMHPKMLQRELNRYGMTFRELRAEVRLDVAERYIRDSDIPLTEIADILGYGELSNFSHAFKARHQVSPTVWRNRVKKGEMIL